MQQITERLIHWASILQDATAAVGVDIGCGMIAVRIQYVAIDLPGVDSTGYVE